MFDRLEQTAARLSGRASAFGTAAALVLMWAITGPVFGFSDTWQLVIMGAINQGAL